MELRDALRRRRMVRSFGPEPVDPALVDELLGATLGLPSAGHTQGTAWLVLTGKDTAHYWERVTTPEWRARSARWPGLSRAPVVALSLASPERYVARYGEPDKRLSGLGPPGEGGGGAESWPVPYWFGDAAFNVLGLLLGATEAGLGACFLGNFRGERPLLESLGVPGGWRLFGAVLLGHPDGGNHPSPSLARPGEPSAARIRHGHW